MTSLDEVRRRAQRDADLHGYYLNPDEAFLRGLLEGMRKNEERYGYPSCPCRAASGTFEIDRDIICPCDYRDPDVQEHGQCYCCLYLDRETYERGETRPIPERRPHEKQARCLGIEVEKTVEKPAGVDVAALTGRSLFFCRVCGYVTFREEPPYVCPICQAKREMFAEIEPDISLKAR